MEIWGLIFYADDVTLYFWEIVRLKILRRLFDSIRFPQWVCAARWPVMVCVCCVVCFVWVCVCVCWVLSPAPRPCDLRAQMCRPIDHKIGVPFWFWQPDCRWRLTSHYLPLPCNPLLPLFFSPLSPYFSPPSPHVAIVAGVNESSSSGTN